MIQLQFRTGLGALALLVSAFSSAHGTASPNGDAKTALLTVPTISTVNVQAGGAAQVTVTVKIKPGYYLTSMTSGGHKFVSSKVRFKLASGLTIGKPTYSGMTEIQHPLNAHAKLRVYENELTAVATIKASAKLKPGNYTAVGYLEYQALTKKAFFPPKSLSTEFKIIVSKSSATKSTTPTPIGKPKGSPAPKPTTKKKG